MAVYDYRCLGTPAGMARLPVQMGGAAVQRRTGAAQRSAGVGRHPAAQKSCMPCTHACILLGSSTLSSSTMHQTM